jgi:SAM-dependent methyltransferase
MDYTAQSSRHSARTIVKHVLAAMPVASVLDVGCARGTWLRAWQEAGVDDVLGVDGSYVDPTTLAIPKERFFAADLSKSFDLGRRFDLVQSLEVAEHIPARSADCFIENLVRHSNGIILFSAAPPGQGGEFHVNEQPYDYWREKFARCGFAAYDCLRPVIVRDKSISFWYRYNSLLYVHVDVAHALAESVRRTRVDDARRIEDVSPLAFRMRKTFVRVLPEPLRQALARAKAHLMSGQGK